MEKKGSGTAETNTFDHAIKAAHKTQSKERRVHLLFNKSAGRIVQIYARPRLRAAPGPAGHAKSLIFAGV